MAKSADGNQQPAIVLLGATPAATATEPVEAPDPCFADRAMLLWPRLDRARIRRIADDPARIAKLVQNRTSQPYEVILAMLNSEAHEGSFSAYTGPREVDGEGLGRIDGTWTDGPPRPTKVGPE